MLSDILQWTGTILFCLALPPLLWQGIVAAMGVFPLRRGRRQEERRYRFAVIACARHEEAVIGNLVDSLLAQDYPRECFDVFVVADNCLNDDTAGQARRHGAIVYERFNRRKVGKGYALSWALEQIDQDYPGRYDAVAVFDADNLAAPNFLTEINAALCSGADVAQGYRDVKNPDDSWVSNCYGVYWMMLTRFYHRARFNWGLSCMVGGTGFAFKKNILGPEGWNTHTLTEDLEFSVRQACEGRHIVPVYGAVFYDEQPAEFGLSLRQRFRWVAGTVQIFRLYLPGILRRLCRHPTPALADATAYLLAVPAVAMTTVSGMLTALGLALDPAAAYWSLAWLMLSFVGGWLAMSILALMTVRIEGKPLRQYRRAVLLYPAFLMPMAYMIFVAVVHSRVEWKPIAHSQSKTIADMR